MTDSPLNSYLAGIDPAAAPLVTALDQAIRSAQPDLDVAVKYRMLMYTLRGEWRNWICAVGASSKAVQLRFLYGVLLNDPVGVLRAGSSHLMTWDFAFDAAINPLAVEVYVAMAVQHHEDFRNDPAGLETATRAAAKEHEPPKAVTASETAPTPPSPTVDQ